MAKKTELTEAQLADLAFLKREAEKTLFQHVNRDGSSDEDYWSLEADGDVDDLADDAVVAVYELVGFKRVSVARSLKTV